MLEGKLHRLPTPPFPSSPRPIPDLHFDSFISFMASYSVILCPLSTIMAVDFFIVKGGKYNVVDLYDPKGIYQYGRYGVNWRALVALLVSVTPNLPGMAASLSPGLDIGDLKVSFFAHSIGLFAD